MENSSTIFLITYEGSDIARIFLCYFNKVCNMFLTKVQQSYCYIKLRNYREEVLLKPLVTYQIFLCVAIKFH